MVIAIHTNPFSEINKNLSYIFTQIIPRIAVPYFFCVMGYYYIKKLQNGKVNFKKEFLKYLYLYLVWSVIYLAYKLLIWLKNDYSMLKIIKSIVSGLFINGMGVHLCFFLGIFFSLIVVTVFYKKFKRLDILAYVSIVLYIIVLLGTSYYEIGNNIPMVKNLINFEQFTFIRRVALMGFPFFMMGYFLQKIDIEKYKIHNCYILEILLSVVFIVEIILINKFSLCKNVFITMGLYLLLFNTMIIFFKKPNVKLSKISDKCRNIANFTYYSHILILQIIILIFNKIFNIYNTTINFFCTTFFCIFIGFVLEKIDNKTINKLYK